MLILVLNYSTLQHKSARRRAINHITIYCEVNLVSIVIVIFAKQECIFPPQYLFHLGILIPILLSISSHYPSAGTSPEYLAGTPLTVVYGKTGFVTILLAVIIPPPLSYFNKYNQALENIESTWIQFLQKGEGNPRWLTHGMSLREFLVPWSFCSSPSTGAASGVDTRHR